MSYRTKVIYDTSPDFSDDPQYVSETGQPESVSLQGLSADTSHWTKAELWENGGLQATSEVVEFKTLPAGTITLNHYNTTRSGYAYDVVYLYTSTYAPSWARLSVNGSTFQGVFDSAQHAVSFLVTGLTPGTAYLDLVTFGDIYGEEASVQGSIITTVVNDIDITSVETEYTTADVNIDYIVDGGFDVGYVEWWLGTKDPLTDQADGYEFFNNGADSVLIEELQAGTDYKFRASITLADQVTTIVSNVVAASTDTDYSSKYFTIENIESGTNGVLLYRDQPYETPNTRVYYSVDGGATWTLIYVQKSGSRINLPSGGKMLLKSTDWGGDAMRIRPGGKYKVYGNIASLVSGDDFRTPVAMGNKTFRNLFIYSDKLIDAGDISFDSFTSVGEYGLEGMFKECTSLVRAPRLPWSTASSYCFSSMFLNCTSLRTPPDLPAVRISTYSYQSTFQGCTNLQTPPVIGATNLPSYCFASMFAGCTSLTVSPDMRYIRGDMYTYCLRSMFANCTSLQTVFAPSPTSWVKNSADDWLNGVAAEGVVYKPLGLEIPTDTPDGVPEGWETQDY